MTEPSSSQDPTSVPSRASDGRATADVTLADALSVSSTIAQARCGSRKAALQTACEIIIDRIVPTDPESPIGAMELFDALVARERLGSTAFGDGVAIPHCRLPGVRGIKAALVTLADSVDFDAPDDAGVDLLCVLIVGTDSGDTHLRLLSQLATVLSVPANRSALRAEGSAQGLHASLLDFAAAGSAG